MMTKEVPAIGPDNAKRRNGMQGFCGLTADQWSPILAKIPLDSWDTVRTVCSEFTAQVYSAPVLAAQCSRLPWAAQQRGRSPIAAPWRAHLQEATQRRTSTAATDAPPSMTLSQAEAAQSVSLHLQLRAENNLTSQRFSEIELLGHKRPPPGLGWSINGAIASPDGSQVLTVYIGAARLYDVNAATTAIHPNATYTQQKVWLCRAGAVFVPHSNLVATGGADGTVHMWAATPGTPQQWALSLPQHGYVQCLCCRDGTSLLAQNSIMRQIFVLNVENGVRRSAPQPLVDAPFYQTSQMSLSVDRYVLYGAHGAEMWDLSRPDTPKGMLLGSRFNYIKEAAMSPCGGYATLRDQSTLTLWDFRRATKPIVTIPYCTALAYSPAGDLLLGGTSVSELVRHAEFECPSTYPNIRWFLNAPSKLECSLDGRWVMSLESTGKLSVLSAKGSQSVSTVPIRGRTIQHFLHATFLPDCQRLLALSTYDASAHVFDFALPLRRNDGDTSES